MYPSTVLSVGPDSQALMMIMNTTEDSTQQPFVELSIIKASLLRKFTKILLTASSWLLLLRFDGLDR